jgi:hypothetical protein
MVLEATKKVAVKGRRCKKETQNKGSQTEQMERKLMMTVKWWSGLCNQPHAHRCRAKGGGEGEGQ